MCIHVEAFKSEYIPHGFVVCESAECKTEEEHCAHLYCGAPREHLVHAGGYSSTGRLCKQCADKIVSRKL